MAGNDLVQSVVRSLDILQKLADYPDGIKLNEIAQQLSVGNSTAHNLLRTLSSRDFVKRNGEGKYCLGSEVFRLAEGYANRDMTRIVGDQLQKVAEDLPDAVLTYSEHVNGEISVILRVSPDLPGRLQKPAGQTFNPYSSATGLLFLALLPEEDKMSIMRNHPFYEEGVRVWPTLEKLESHNSETHEKKYSLVPFKEPFIRLASPVIDKQGAVVGAIGVSLKAADKKQKTVNHILGIFSKIQDDILQINNKE